MDIVYRIRGARDLTPTEQHLANTVLNLGERMQDYTIKELARTTSTSIASIHRLCRKLGLEGFKELKVELARSEARRVAPTEEVDINFPVKAGETAEMIAPRMELLYAETLRETREMLGTRDLDRAAELIARARQVNIYTTSHNLYPANMFCDRLLSTGRSATCYESIERQVRTALAATSEHAAVFISYSGLAANCFSLVAPLKERGCPIILIGTPHAALLNPGFDVYLRISDRESLHNRITQFASHLAVQYALDTLFSCYLARTYDEGTAFLRNSLPYLKRQDETTLGTVVRSPSGPGEASTAQASTTLDMLQSMR